MTAATLARLGAGSGGRGTSSSPSTRSAMREASMISDRDCQCRPLDCRWTSWRRAGRRLTSYSTAWHASEISECTRATARLNRAVNTCTPSDSPMSMAGDEPSSCDRAFAAGSPRSAPTIRQNAADSSGHVNSRACACRWTETCWCQSSRTRSCRSRGKTDTGSLPVAFAHVWTSDKNTDADRPLLRDS